MIHTRVILYLALELILSASLLFKVMKKMDATLGDVELLPLETIGDHLIKYRRKEHSIKKNIPGIM
jgi:hypothetical protein